MSSNASGLRTLNLSKQSWLPAYRCDQTKLLHDPLKTNLRINWFLFCLNAVTHHICACEALLLPSVLISVLLLWSPPLIENMRVSEASIKLSCTTTLHGTFIFKDIAPLPLKIEQNSVIWEIVKLVVSITVGLGHCWAASPLSLSIWKAKKSFLGFGAFSDA